MRFNQAEKYEIIRIVEGSELGVNRTLHELGIHKSTFYAWYNRYKQYGYDGLSPRQADRKFFWNQIPSEEKQKVVELALEYPGLSPRELAHRIIDHEGWYISESSIYRILKARGLITSPTHIVMSAADEFKDKTTRIHQLWQTDFSYLKVVGWGWYYLTTVLDDYSRYIIAWDLCKSMKAEDVQNILEQALDTTGLSLDNRPRLLSDNGSCYISKDLRKYLSVEEIKHVRGAPNHPQTQGKIERYHRSMKNVIKLDNYYSPGELKQRLSEFIEYYNNYRYHESLNNLTPADVFYGRDQKILEKRQQVKLETIKNRRNEYVNKKLNLSA